MNEASLSTVKLFQSKQIRSIWSDKEQKWFFSVVDVVGALTDSQNPQVYWRVLKKRLIAEGNETVTNCNALKMTAPDGKMRLTDVADTEQLLRLIQSIPSPKAEPFKRWLARVGFERLEEIGNPELAMDRMKGLEQENLRDHMTDIELILTMLGEATTTKLHRDRDSKGFDPLKKDAQEGGAVAGSTRKDIEKRSGKPVVTSENYKALAGKERKKLDK